MKKRPFQHFMLYIEIMKFCQNPWSLIGNRTVKPVWILQSGYEELMHQLERYLAAKNKN
jgi:hypothetical protein